MQKTNTYSNYYIGYISLPCKDLGRGQNWLLARKKNPLKSVVSMCSCFSGPEQRPQLLHFFSVPFSFFPRLSFFDPLYAKAWITHTLLLVWGC